MITRAPEPTHTDTVLKAGHALSNHKEYDMEDISNPPVSLTLVGCGGAGTNLARPHTPNGLLDKVIYFDTSGANRRPGEETVILTNGSGSGSVRAENAMNLERVIPQKSDADLGLNDVVLVVFSLSSGSGSVIGPLLVREYNKRKARVIALAVADTGYAVGAHNTMKTLKTLMSICRNNDIYLPMVLLSNDNKNGRNGVDRIAPLLINDIISILKLPVSEVDRQDRLNWINPTKAISTSPGIKILSFVQEGAKHDPELVVGGDSEEMVDSTLILQMRGAEKGADTLRLPSRLKKLGFYTDGDLPTLIGTISSDITAVNAIIDNVERMEHLEKTQKHKSVDRLDTSGESDLIL